MFRDLFPHTQQIPQTPSHLLFRLRQNKMSENYNWQKDLTTKLVVLYQECANLYDPNDPTYDDEEIRAATLDEIVTELKQFDPSLTLDIVWSKIQSFHNEMALVNEYSLL